MLLFAFIHSYIIERLTLQSILDHLITTESTQPNINAQYQPQDLILRNRMLMVRINYNFGTFCSGHKSILIIIKAGFKIMDSFNFLSFPEFLDFSESQFQFEIESERDPNDYSRFSFENSNSHSWHPKRTVYAQDDVSKNYQIPQTQAWRPNKPIKPRILTYMRKVPSSQEEVSQLLTHIIEKEANWQRSAAQLFKFAQLRSNLMASQQRFQYLQNKIWGFLVKQLDPLIKQCMWAEQIFAEYLSPIIYKASPQDIPAKPHSNQKSQLKYSQTKQYISEQDVFMLMSKHYSEHYHSQLQPNFIQRDQIGPEQSESKQYLFCRLNKLRNPSLCQSQAIYKIMRVAVAYKLLECLQQKKKPLSLKNMNTDRPIVFYLLFQHCRSSAKEFKKKYHLFCQYLTILANTFNLKFTYINTPKMPTLKQISALCSQKQKQKLSFCSANGKK